MNFDLALKRINRLKRERPEAEEVLNLYQNILEFQRSSFERTGIKYEDLPASLAVEKPLIQILEKNLSGEVVSKLFLDFFEFISLFGTPKMKESAKGATEMEFFSEENAKRTLKNFVEKEEVVPGIPPEFLRLSVLSVAPVLFSPLSKFLEKQLPEDFESVKCPYCGFRAQVGYLSKSHEGKRFLVCPVCYGEWPIKRDRCAYCGKEDLEAHYYYLSDSKEDNHLRVEICEECNRYVKTIDERVLDEKGEPCVPLVEDVASPYLDIKLLEEGYEKVNKNLFGF